MITRYLTYLLKELLLRMLNFVVFPVAYLVRHKVKKGFLWWFLHDGGNYGDMYFNPNQKKTFWWAYRWAIRNPLHNYYYSHKITGEKLCYEGFATIQNRKRDNGRMWRTLLTTDKQGVFKFKYGKWIDIENSILGKQRITFYINDEKYFRFSGCIPRKLWGNLYWCPEYKFGFESTNWAVQFHPFLFKRFKGKITYQNIQI